MSSSLKPLFQLRPDITYLNFGSFGACPKPIFEAYIDFERELEQEPVQFIVVKGPQYLEASRQALGDFIHAHKDDIVFTPNPTFAINIVARNFKLEPDDEILSTDIEYGALDRTWDYYCDQQKAKFVRQHISLPVTSKEQLMDDFWKGYSPKTKAIFISQITSATAIILPVKEICEEAKKRGLITIVDGAHVPGHIHLDLSQLKADYYTGACHKWMMTPKGNSFLYVKKELQNNLDPLIVSWGYKSDNPSASQFLDYHQFNGTRDFSAFLTIPKAIEFMKKHEWESVSNTYKEMVLKWTPVFCKLLQTEPLAPLTNEWFGQMASIRLPDSAPKNLKDILYEKHGIEIPVTQQNGIRYIRFSLNAFNTESDLVKLSEALKQELHLA